MRKFVARLHELELRVALADPSPQVASLRVKVQRSPCWFAGVTAVSASRELDRLELQANRDRIHAWKARLQSSDKALYRWLKGHAEPVSHNLLDDEACGPPVVSLDPVGALGCLTSFWRRVWDRPSDLEADFEQYLATYGDGAWATQSWPSLSAAQLKLAATRQAHRCGGLDGWLGDELLLFPDEFWEAVAVLVEHFEGVGCFPSAWGLVKQAHIPKPCPVEASHIPVSSLRPISVLSVWWRIIASARVRSPEVSDWIQRVLPEFMVGGRKGVDVLGAVCPLVADAENNRYLGSLDFTKAFDHVRPAKIALALRYHGAPRSFVDALMSIWLRQRRVLVWHGVVSPQVQHVDSSIPQGDPWSVFAMGLLLRLPSLALQRVEPDLRLLFFVDDRSWSCSSPEACRRTFDFWLDHSAWLGLRENFTKAQFFHPTRAGRDRLGRCRLSASSGITVLGVHITDGNLRRNTSVKEKKRLCKGVAVAAKCRFLPGHFSRKSLACSMASCSVAAWGWLQRAPPDSYIAQLDRSFRSAVGIVRGASPPLVQLLLGHGSLGFLSGCQAFCSLLRFVRRLGRMPLDWNRSFGVVARLRNFMASIGLTEVSAWLWRGPPLLGRLSLDPAHHAFYRDSRAAAHILREAWRASCWSAHVQSGRIDAAVGSYSAPAVKMVQRWVRMLDRHAVAILCGGYCSHARYASHVGQSVQCPFCHRCPGTREHLWFHCPATGLGWIPSRASQRLIGWPSGVDADEASDLAILKALALVRKRELDVRYGG